MLKPHEYQERAINFHLDNPASYCALDMGLGKTLISINWIKAILPEVGGALVIAPIRTLDSSWPEELEKWGPELKYEILHGPMKDVRLRKPADVYLINYEGLGWLLPQIKKIFKKTGKIPFRGLVMDEGAKGKSHATMRFTMLSILADACPKWKLILSGTPSPNSLLDLWAQYFYLDKGERLYPNITAYRSQYFTQYEIKQKKMKDGTKKVTTKKLFGYQIKPFCDEIIHQKIGDITFRLDAKDYIKLPEKIINTIKIKLPPKIMEQYKKLEDKFFIALGDIDPTLGEEELEALNAPSLAMKLRQFVQGGLYTDESKDKTKGERPYAVIHKEKLKVLQSLVEEANGQGILCPIQFRFEMDMIKQVFPDAQVIAGGVSPKKSGEIIRAWNRGEIPLLLCHPASLAEGVNLQTGSHLIVWFGLTWSLYQYLQFNARLYRQGQKNAVIIHHLVVSGTIDDAIMKALTNKFKGMRELLDYLRELR